MKNFNVQLKNLCSDESGQDMIEYALVAALVGLGSVTILGTLSTAIGSALTKVTTTLNNAM
jgi:pilus assembly protein Flp/PilA